jgi:hypothetical protein
MKVQILKNEPFALLLVATGYSEKTLEELLLKRMIDENIMCGDTNECGYSLQSIAFESGYDVLMLMDVLFPEGMDNPEVFQMMDSIMVWGLADEHMCPLCGNKCDVEHDSTDGTPSSIKWKNWTCSNHECDFEDTTEPDVDVLPCGYDHKHDLSC